MKYYFAPMEGITGYIYRNTFHQYFGHMDEYYTPFVTPTQTRSLTSRELKDTLPANNKDLRVIPQILTNKPDDFLWAAEKMQEFGYDEVNLNLGCPSRTVVSKKRGSGFLSETKDLDVFLYQISKRMERMGMKLSIKTRIGKDSPEEFEELLRIYNQYPLSKLIIHPRIQTDYYKNRPKLEVFQMAVEQSRHSICYNGDLFSVEDVKTFCSRFPQVEHLMLGRGLLCNPAMIQMAEGKTEKLEKERFHAFHNALLEQYRSALSGDRNALFKMKELWFYMGDAFVDGKKYIKKIRKAEKMKDYDAAVSAVFRDCEIAEMPVFTSWR